MDFLTYPTADEFFHHYQWMGLTFDDIALATRYSEVLPRETDLSVSLSDSVHLQIPILSADMDTVTESAMAIQMALNGGMGLIHYNLSEVQQIKEVARVKNHIHGFIQEPIKVNPDWTLGKVLDFIHDRHFGFSTFPVVDEHNHLLGLLSGAVVKRRYHQCSVREVMTPRKEVYTLHEKDILLHPIQTADDFFTRHPGIHKLLVVDDHDCLRGLFTLSDIERIQEEARQRVKPARDARFRLLCGVAISPTRTADGDIDRIRIIEHLERLLEEGVDVVAVSSAHGFSRGIGEVVRLVREQFKTLTLIAGNVTCAEGVEYLAQAGANAVKVGQGPGSICTTRVVCGVGIPQMTALYVAAQAAQRVRVKLLADGGINKSGDMVKALTLADAVICGGLFAGCNEAPGRILEIHGTRYKQYRGMGSREAMAEGSAVRYGHVGRDALAKAAPEGIEALKEASGPLDGVLREVTGGLQAGLGYLGASNLQMLKTQARYIRVSPAGQRESFPHDVVTITASQDVVRAS